MVEQKSCFAATIFEQSLALRHKCLKKKSSFTPIMVKQKSCLAPKLFEQKFDFTPQMFAPNIPRILALHLKC